MILGDLRIQPTPLRSCFRGLGGGSNKPKSLGTPSASGRTLSDDLVHIPTILWMEKPRARLAPKPLIPSPGSSHCAGRRGASEQVPAGRSDMRTRPHCGIQRAHLFTKRFTNIRLCLPTAPCEVGQ